MILDIVYTMPVSQGTESETSDQSSGPNTREEKVLTSLLTRLYDKKDIEGVPKTHLHKLLFMIDKEAEEDVETGVHPYWYRYGPVVETVNNLEASFGPEMIDSHQKNNNTLYEPTEKMEKEAEGINPELSEVIDDVVDQANPFRMNRLTYKIYEQYAPFDFQITFRYRLLSALSDLREYVTGQQKSIAAFSEDSTPKVLREFRFQLQESQIDLPEHDLFGPFNDVYLMFVSYVEDYIEQAESLGKEDVEHLEELAEDDIWNTFANGLRVLTNEKITDKQRRLWKDEYLSDVEAVKVKIERLSERNIEYEDIEVGNGWSRVIKSHLEG